MLMKSFHLQGLRSGRPLFPKYSRARGFSGTNRGESQMIRMMRTDVLMDVYSIWWGNGAVTQCKSRSVSKPHMLYNIMMDVLVK